MLPNIPRFIYADGTDYIMDLPCLPWVRSLRVVGGDIESDSGSRAGYVVRRDELLAVTLRLHETHWPELQTFIDFAQTGVPFIWFPDATDDTVSFTVCLDAPASGTTYKTTLDEGLPRVQLLTITLVEPGAPGTPWSGLPSFEPRKPIVPPGPLQPVRLQIDPEINPMLDETTLQLVPTFYDSFGHVIPDLEPTSWECDNEDITSVDSNGLITAHSGTEFLLHNANSFVDYAWTFSGTTPEEVDGDILGRTFWRVFGDGDLKQDLLLQDDADIFVTVFVRSDNVTGTVEGGLRDVDSSTDKIKYRFTITSSGSIALTLLAGTLVRAVALTQGVRAYTFKAPGVSADDSYIFYARSGGTATSFQMAYAILTADIDPVSAILAKYDVGAVHLTSNAAVQFIDDTLRIIDVTESRTVHVNGTVQVFAIGGGGGGSGGTTQPGGGGGVDGQLYTGNDDMIITVGLGGSISGNGGNTQVVMFGNPTLLVHGGFAGAGGEFAGDSGAPNINDGGSAAGAGHSGGDASASGGGGGAGGPGSNAGAASPAVAFAGGGGPGFLLIFEGYVIGIFGGGAGGGGSQSGDGTSSAAGGGAGGGGSGGLNRDGTSGTPNTGGGGGNGTPGGSGRVFIIYHAGDAIVT